MSKENAKGNKEGVQDAVCQALFVAVLIAAIGTPLFFFYPDKTLGTVLESGAPAMKFAKIYLAVRAFSFLPALIALVGFSAFRGKVHPMGVVSVQRIGTIPNVRSGLTNERSVSLATFQEFWTSRLPS